MSEVRFCLEEVEKRRSVLLFSPLRLNTDRNSVLEAIFEVKIIRCPDMSAENVIVLQQGFTHSYAS